MPSAASPATLDHDGIAARIPHRGSMCLLARLKHWTADAIHCEADNHRAANHPLRSARGLLAPAAIEYAAQAMALHGGLCNSQRNGPGDGPTPGYLVSARGVRFHVLRLDQAEGPLQVHAERLAGDDARVMYAFRVCAPNGAALVDGRAAVVLDAAQARPWPADER